MRLLRVGAILAAACALSSCQPPEYEFRTFARNGSLHFDIYFPGSWPFRWDKLDAEASYLEVVTSDEILWAIEASKDPSCTTVTANPDYREPAHITFPLKFGVPPRCFVTLVAPARLPSGRDILVRSMGGITEGSGLFRIEAGRLARASEGGDLRNSAPSRSQWWGIAEMRPVEPANDASAARGGIAE